MPWEPREPLLLKGNNSSANTALNSLQDFHRSQQLNARDERVFIFDFNTVIFVMSAAFVMLLPFLAEPFARQEIKSLYLCKM